MSQTYLLFALAALAQRCPCNLAHGALGRGAELLAGELGDLLAGVCHTKNRLGT